MAELSIHRPAPEECTPGHLHLLSEIPDTELFEALGRQESFLEGLASALNPHGHESYAPGKWTVCGVVGHLSDCERIFGYRMLCAARGETAPLNLFDENAYAAMGDFDSRPLAAILKDFAAARFANVRFLRSLPEVAWDRRLTLSGKTVTLRAVAWTTAAHALHHAGVLRERYLPLVRPDEAVDPD